MRGLTRAPLALVALAGHLVAGVALCVGSAFVWGYLAWSGGTVLVQPWDARGYETWSGRVALIAGVALVALAISGLRTRSAPRGLWVWLAAASTVAVIGVLAWTAEIPDSSPGKVIYRPGTGYWVSVAGGALAVASSLLGLAARRHSR